MNSFDFRNMLDKNPFELASPHDNYEQRCLCILLIDRSSSMDAMYQGKTYMDWVNQGLQAFLADVKQDLTASQRLEVSVIAFDTDVQVLQEADSIDNIHLRPIGTGGSTSMVEAIRVAMSRVEYRKEWYKKQGIPYYRPFIVLFTDGEPNSGASVPACGQDVRAAVDAKKFVFIPVGVGDYNKKILAELSHPSLPPQTIHEAKILDFFQWLSASMIKVSQSSPGNQVKFPEPTWTFNV